MLLIVLCPFVAGCVPFSVVPYEVSGRVVRADDESVGVADVRLYFTGDRSFGTATTGPDGTWSKSGLKGTVAIGAAMTGWTFEPSIKRVTGSEKHVDFLGTRRMMAAPGVRQMAAGDHHVLYVKSDGTVWYWGYSPCGQLDKYAQYAFFEPRQVEGIDGVAAVAAGQSHSLALNADGTAWHWGWAYPGTSIYSVRSRPTRVGQV